MPATVFWFRNDLRLADNPGLLAASQDAERDGGLILLYILDEQELGDGWSLGGASRWWLAGALEDLSARIEGYGGKLIVAKGPAEVVLSDLVQSLSVSSLHFNLSYLPSVCRRDRELSDKLERQGVRVQSHHGNALVAPGSLVSRSGSPFKVFTPFWKALVAEFEGRDAQSRQPLPEPGRLRFFGDVGPFYGRCQGDQLGLLSEKSGRWADKLAQHWQVGERAATERLASFLATGIAGYAELHNRPDLPHVSRLSPYLRWGHISPRQVWHSLAQTPPSYEESPKDRAVFLTELGWREFSYELLNQFPDLPNANWRPAFDSYPWQESNEALRAWQEARTGYPLVDAGMRQLWAEGWMHNRLRMVTASFLIKHLQIDWRAGQAWFWDTLVDADLASNAASWQWVAGSGADASPYFRVFNPTTQAKKFDPEGRFVRRYLPRLRELPVPDIFEPWLSVTPPASYPAPIVDHGAARQRALEGYEQVRAVGR